MRRVSIPSNQTSVHLNFGPAKSIRAALVITVLVFAIVSPGKTTATTITVSTTSDFKTSNLGATGTFFLDVYSQQYRSLNPASPPIGPNATQSLTNVIGGVPGTGTPAAGLSIIVSTGVVGQNSVEMLYAGNGKASERTVAYGPTIRVPSTINAKKQVVQPQKSTLTMPGDNVTLTSTSGMYTAQAAAFQATPKGEIFASTSVDGTPPPTGQTAAQAIDPFTVPSGSLYPYDPTVTASIEIDSTNIAGGIAEFAVDSSTFTSDTLDNFVDDGSPLDQTLWYLSVGAGTPTTRANSVLVDFEINPLALNEIMFSPSFLASLGSYSDATSEVLLIDNAIDRYITSQLEPDDAAVDLNDVSIFPVDTMFQAIDGGVEYADGIDAVVGSVPEPASLAILAFGLVALAAFRFRATYQASSTRSA